MAPSFDVVRVEPAGDAVVAGRASPGATVVLVVDGRDHARAVADGSGAFAIVADPIAPGSHAVVLEATGPDGVRLPSREVVTVVVAENRRERPLVTVTAPGRPTVIVSRPDSPPGPVASAGPLPAPPPAVPAQATPPPSSAPAAEPSRTVASAPAPLPGPQSQTPAPAERAGRGTVRVESVEIEAPGRLFVSGIGAPGATVRLYLNDTLVASGTAAPDGRISFSVERGIRTGRYRVRLDEMEAGAGRVASRAEVPFDMPAMVMASAEPVVMPVAGPSNAAAAQPVPAPATARLPPAARPVAALPAAPRPAPAVVRARGGGGPATVVATAGFAPARAAARRAATVTVATIATATVSPGESLWAISHRLYGDGNRYTVIYGANSQQIRNPNLIYPGQVFVMPAGAR